MKQHSSLEGRFVELLARRLSEFADQDLGAAWFSSDRRTRFYREQLLPPVADWMDYDFSRERLLIDYVFLERDHQVPVVFIESENSPFLAGQEVGKLAATRAPLRVLFTVTEWTPSRELWPATGGFRDVLLPAWRAIVANHTKIYGSAGGAFLLIVGEWRRDQSLAFHAHRLDADPAISSADDDSVFWHRTMSVSQSDAARAV